MNGTAWAVIAVSVVRFYEMGWNSHGEEFDAKGEKEETNDNI
jgi:hypothetical protein